MSSGRGSEVDGGDGFASMKVLAVTESHASNGKLYGMSFTIASTLHILKKHLYSPTVWQGHLLTGPAYDLPYGTAWDTACS